MVFPFLFPVRVPLTFTLTSTRRIVANFEGKKPLRNEKNGIDGARHARETGGGQGTRARRRGIAPCAAPLVPCAQKHCIVLPLRLHSRPPLPIAALPTPVW